MKAEEKKPIGAAYCSKELSQLLDKAGIKAHCVIQYEKGGSWYRKYTLDIAQRWLREEKYVLIFMVPGKDEQGNLEYLADVWTWNEEEGLYEPHWATANYVYEKALEAAIKHSVDELMMEANQ